MIKCTVTHFKISYIFLHKGTPALILHFALTFPYFWRASQFAKIVFFVDWKCIPSKKSNLAYKYANKSIFVFNDFHTKKSYN